jgi:HAD superfamily hydrolase (TIGR01549 family)
VLRGIFFDLDDTLIGYSEAQTIALHAASRVALSRYPRLTPDILSSAVFGAYLARYEQGTPGFQHLATLPTQTLWRHITQDALDLLGVRDQALLEQMLDVYSQTEREALHAFPDTQATLAQLRPHFFLGVITNGPSAMQRDKLAVLALDGSFDAIIVDTEFGHSKPDPRIFHHAAALAKLRPPELLFVGNSMSDDVTGAKNAGWPCVWVSRDKTEPPANAPAPDFCVTKLSEVCDLAPVREALLALSPAPTLPTSPPSRND